MSDLNMSNWFKLPVDCSHMADDTEVVGSSDSIAIDGCVVLTDHHAEKVEIAINSYDSNQELIASQKKEIEQFYDLSVRDSERVIKQAGQVKLLREALIGMVTAVDNHYSDDPEFSNAYIGMTEALAATAKG